MPLIIGDRLGPYEITALLGVGGMGEVYRATDTDLKRAVAIKVLPDPRTMHADRLSRFQREAEILASLNHPHIAQIHGLQKDGGRTALVMELIDGATLAQRIDAGPIPVEEALSIAKQIAAALEAAHERGIIHRDLKPANVKIRRDGTVKVLDFGLAKLIDVSGMDRLEGPSALSASPTITAPFTTQSGMVLGTAAYMAPEQAKGADADRRADIWAFGCVVYEMLTGRRAFQGDSVLETLAAVMHDDPDWSRLPAGVSATLRLLLRRCLARDPHRRVSHMAAVTFALDEDRAQAADVAAPTNAQRSRGRGLATLAVATLLIGAATGVVVWWLAPRPSLTRVVRTTIPEATFVPGTDPTIALTPDGTKLAFVSSDATQIRVRPLDALPSATVVATSSFLRCLFSSPDGEWIGYVENNYTLKKVPVAGGATVTLLTTDGPTRGAAWGPDDTIVFATGEIATGLQRISADGGAVTVLTRPARERGESDHVNPAWLPGGDRVLFTILALQGGLNAAKVAVLDLSTGTWRTVVDGAYGGRYVDSGHLVYAAAGALWATRFDLSRLETRGAPVKVLPQVSVGAIGGLAHFDVAANGTLVYPQGARDYYSRSRVPVWVDRNGRETPVAAPRDAYQHPRLSPDSTRLAVVITGDIYVLDVSRPGSPLSRLTLAPGSDWYPVWTPDSRRIVFGSWRGGGFSNLYVQDADGGSAERLTESPDMQLPTSITLDGKVVFHSFPKDIHTLRLQAPHEVATVAGTPVEERNGAVSPDGRWLAYEGETASGSGVLEVFVRSFPDVDRGTWQVSRGGGAFPAWARNGGELYYLKTDGTMVGVPVEANGDSWKAGSPTDLFQGPYLMLGDGSMARQYDVAADGRFLMLRDDAADTASRAHFIVVQNWATELARQVP